ncbi:ATP-binding cassette domain-containing protein [Halobellus clavatus]|uniref:Cobalamin import ATP-binding protein BtuD n=1 Tax=Halobellus clavatus TaxID=660517 RepID=A0A1H3HZX7_9EURY|nr:ATP-binding cassette domain-containing protein [Halobellus clavatus]SDY21011.1 iron complex transport system ATP-binding protein [Halobellus clavatus]
MNDDASNTRDDPLVRIDGLRVAFGETTVLDGINATIEPGTFVGLVGPNGAGKTTLLRTLNGTQAPEAGTVDVAGERIPALDSKAASRLVATVPQDTAVAFEFDVRQVVEMGRNPHRSRFSGWSDADEAAVERALDRTDTEQFVDRSVSTLSGGERQRVVLARALAQETPLLLLDEPTASLDINHQVRTLELVRDLVRQGKTAVAAIHDLNLAAHYCDELLLLAGGEIRAQGSPESILTETALQEAFDANAVVSQHPVTGSVYVTALPDETAERAQGQETSRSRPERVHVVGGGGTAARHLYVLDAAGYDVSVGALNEGDTDTEAARSLALDVETVEPFAGVDPESCAAVERRIDAADCVVVADVEIGTGNLPNLRAATAADEVVLVEDRPFEERNYVGPAATEVYESLRERARVVESSDVLSAVTDAVDGSSVTDADNAAGGSLSRRPAQPGPEEPDS